MSMCLSSDKTDFVFTPLLETMAIMGKSMQIKHKLLLMFSVK